jgi:hypothetical protein
MRDLSTSFQKPRLTIPADPLTQRESAREVFTCFWGNERKDPEVDGVLCNSESQL